MDRVFAADSAAVQKLRIRLIRQSRRFETFASAAAVRVFSRDPLQLRINAITLSSPSALPSFQAASGGGPLPSCRIVAINQSHFVQVGSGTEIEFIKDAQGVAKQLIFHIAEGNTRAVRMTK